MRRIMDWCVLLAVEAAMQVRHARTVHFARHWEPRKLRWRRVAVPLCANDKFVWRKLFDRDPRFTILSDKLACKAWVGVRAPDLGRASVLWQGKDPAEIPDALLQGPVIVKTNHGCGDHIIIQDATPDRAQIETSMRALLAFDHGAWTMQWGYFNVPRRVFVEELLGGGGPLQELKFYTFGRRIERLIQINDRFGEMGANSYEPDSEGHLRRLDRDSAVVSAQLDLPLPACFEHAKRIARALGSEFDHMRVDILTDGEQAWLGEMTIYNLGGHLSHNGHDPEEQITRAWDIRRSWFLSTPQPGWRGAYAGALRRKLDRMADKAPPLPPA